MSQWFRQADARRAASQAWPGLGNRRHIVQLHGRHGPRAAAQGRRDLHRSSCPSTAGRDRPSAARDAPARPAGHRLDAARVLVVEDDENTRELVRVTLEGAGAYVETVATAGDARREMLAGPPAVLISDIRMPEEDGYSLMRSLRGAGISTPSIALTAYARHEDADEARAAGFQIHLAKPVDAGRLIDAVATLLQRGRVH